MKNRFIKAIECTSQTPASLLFQTPQLLVVMLFLLVALMVLGGLFIVTLFFVLGIACQLITMLIILTGIAGLLLANFREVEFDKQTGKVFIRDTMIVLQKKSFQVFRIEDITGFDIEQKQIYKFLTLFGKTVNTYNINMLTTNGPIELGTDFHRQYAQWKVTAIEEFLWPGA